MYLIQAIYPLALASVNLVVGWLLYGLFGTLFGGLFVVVGLLVILTLVGDGPGEDAYRPDKFL